jgi:hypothetical protein
MGANSETNATRAIMPEKQSILERELRNNSVLTITVVDLLYTIYDCALLSLIKLDQPNNSLKFNFIFD